MKTFVIDSANNVSAYASDEVDHLPDGGAKFVNEQQLAALAAGWAGVRLVEVWNKLPDVKQVIKFTDRKTAVHRIWAATQKLEPMGTKTGRIIALLKQPLGASLQTLMDLTGWQAHSVRGFISGQLSKRMGLRIKSFKLDGQRVYRIIQNPPVRGTRRKEKA